MFVDQNRFDIAARDYYYIGKNKYNIYMNRTIFILSIEKLLLSYQVKWITEIYLKEKKYFLRHYIFNYEYPFFETIVQLRRVARNFLRGGPKIFQISLLESPMCSFLGAAVTI